MGFFSRLFGGGAAAAPSQDDQIKQAQAQATAAREQARGDHKDVPIERQGINGEFDQSGLAKRVAQAFDADSQIDDVETLWVAQTGNTIVLKGKVPSQQILDRMVEVAQNVNGTGAVNSDAVTVEG